MKKLHGWYGSLFALALFFGQVAIADDISVIVNGRTYQCSGGGSGPSQYKTFCKCDDDNNTYGLYLYKLDLVNGGPAVKVAHIDAYGKLAGETSWAPALERCRAAVNTQSLCR